MKSDVPEICLTPSQEAMLSATLREPNDPPYLIQLLMPLAPEQPFASSEWSAAWQRVSDADTLLRLVYAGGRVSADPPGTPAEWSTRDHSQLSPRAFAVEVQRACARERSAGFDLRDGGAARLCRSLWLDAPSGEASVWCLTIHHALVDGGSLAPLIARVVAALESEPNHAEDRAAPFFNWARGVCQRDWEPARAFFAARRPADASAGHLGASFPRTGERVGESGARHRAPLPLDSALQRLLEGQRQHRPITWVHAAWSLVAARIAECECVVFGVTRHCRGADADGLRASLGSFSNSLPLGLAIPEDISVDAWLGNLRRCWRELAEFECCPLREISRSSDCLGPEGRPFETLVNVVAETPEASVAAALGPLAARRPALHQKTDMPLSLVVALEPELQGFLVARADRFSRESVERLAELFVHALRQILSEPQARVGDLSLWDARTPHPGVGRVARRTERERSVVALLRDTATRQGDLVALTGAGGSLSFSELWRRAGDVARALERRGVGREEVVALLTGRSAETIIAMIGCLRVGGAFFVVGEDLPIERQLALLRASGCRSLVCDGERGAALRQRIPELQPLDPAQLPTANGEPAPCAAPAERDLAYLVSTSGTTGTPRLVMIEHGGLANMLAGYAAVLRPGAGDIRYQSATASSDTFVLEVFLYLCHGAGLHLDPRLLGLGLAGFDTALRRHGVSIVGLPSSLWREWALRGRDRSRTGETLRAVVCSMERTDAAALRRWRGGAGRGLLWLNAYGPSETTCVATLFPLQPGVAAPEGEIPIGRPLPNVHVYVVDDQLRHKPIGVVGEIAIGGLGVGRGYLNDPARNATAFVRDPFAADPDARLYRSGDRGYFRPDGELVFVGRLDNQKKIRGHRIELEEVELALMRHADVRDAAAVAVPVRDGRITQLVAFYTPAEPRDLDGHTLREHLRALLPPAAIPHRFARRDAIPRSPLGKVARQVLVDEARAGLRGEKRLGGAPGWRNSDTLEEKLCSLFGRVLELHGFDARDDFFMLGGDSLCAAMLLSDIEDHTGHSATLTDLFLHPTPAALAVHLERDPGRSTGRCLVPLSPGGDAPPLLFLHGVMGEVFQHLPLAHALGSHRPVWGVQAIEHAGRDRDPCIETMCGRYAEEIAREFEGRPCFLAGYSLGGLVAFETARHLLRAGHPVERLLIIDSRPMNLPMATHLRMHAGYLWRRAKLHLETLLRERRNPQRFVRERLLGLRRVVARGGSPNEQQRESLGINLSTDHYVSLFRQHAPQPLRVRATLLQSQSGQVDPAPGWRYLARDGLRVVSVPWPHLAIMKEAALRDLTAVMEAELAL